MKCKHCYCKQAHLLEVCDFCKNIRPCLDCQIDYSEYESGYSAVSRDILSDGLEYCKKMLQSYTYTFLRSGIIHSDFERGMIDARLDSLGL
jgi:hypothetical protein